MMGKKSFALAGWLACAGATQWIGASAAAAATAPVRELVAVLNSDAGHKEKADACRQLAVVGTRDAVAPLAALLGDEQLSHMARYALEPIPDPAVDDALRAALGTVKGRPLLGVIASIGVRRDPRAVPALGTILRGPDAEPARAAARALGSIGTTEAAGALQLAATAAPEAQHRLALAEGLLRCAEALAAGGRRDQAIAIYDQLRAGDGPHQVRAGALRGAIRARGPGGLALLAEQLRSDDYILFSAAAQTAQELPGTDVTPALVGAVAALPADRQVLLIQCMAQRGDRAVLPALLDLARAGTAPQPTRVAAIRALPGLGDASAVAVLDALVDDPDREIAQAAHDALAALVTE